MKKVPDWLVSLIAAVLMVAVIVFIVNYIPYKTFNVGRVAIEEEKRIVKRLTTVAVEESVVRNILKKERLRNNIKN